MADKDSQQVSLLARLDELRAENDRLVSLGSELHQDFLKLSKEADILREDNAVLRVMLREERDQVDLLTKAARAERCKCDDQRSRCVDLEIAIRKLQATVLRLQEEHA